MASNPPRFVPTLTESAPSLTPSTEVEDHDYFETRDDDKPDSMLDFDLDDLNGPVSRIEQVSPLGDYQGEAIVNPDAVSHIPVVSKPTVKRAVAPPPVVSNTQVSATHPSAVPSSPAASPLRVTATLRPTPAAEPPAKKPTLPVDWQDQLQESIKQVVRQELQQQMPFLLLQWSKQIEDKLSPQIHQKLAKKIEIWLKD